MSKATMRWWRALIVSLVGAAIVLAGTVPARWDGARTPTTMFLPLRPLTGVEAALLLTEASVDRDGDPTTAVTALSDGDVTVDTRYVVFPERPDAAEVLGRATVDGRAYTVHAASWGPYVSRYRLPRPELEAALGRRLTRADVRADAFANRVVSFEANAMPRYVLTELLVLAAMFMVTLCAWLGTGRWWPASIGLAATLVLLLFALPRYVPPLGDADFFYHRIVLELIGQWGGLFVAPSLFAAGAAGALFEFVPRLRAGASVDVPVHR